MNMHLLKENLNKLQYIYMVKYYVTIKKRDKFTRIDLKEYPCYIINAKKLSHE